MMMTMMMIDFSMINQSVKMHLFSRIKCISGVFQEGLRIRILKVLELL